MARLLAISSQVARGAVGLSIIVPALQRLGHEIIALPTVMLSNHPGHAHTAGERIAQQALSRMVDALDANGWLAGIDAVLTGYLPTLAHVHFAVATIGRVKAASPAACVACDPVLGDDPKGLYIAGDAATAIRERLLPVADLATPNRFELAWLTGRDVTCPDEAARALACLACGGGLATSIPCPDKGLLSNILAHGATLAETRVPVRANAPNGTGDLMAALFVAALTAKAAPTAALSFATAGVDAALTATRGRDSLDPAGLPTGAVMASWPILDHGAAAPGSSPPVR